MQAARTADLKAVRAVPLEEITDLTAVMMAALAARAVDKAASLIITRTAVRVSDN